MSKIIMVAVVVIFLAALASAAPAQTSVTPNDLKINPPKYKNSYIKVEDKFIHLWATIPFPFPQAGYTLERYLTFGLWKSGIRCFIRRSAENEKMISRLKNGDKITLFGYIRQPRVTVGGEIKIREKSEKYIFEVSAIDRGWE